MNGSKILAFRKPSWSLTDKCSFDQEKRLFVKKSLVCEKLPCLRKISLIKGKYLFVINFLDQEKCFVCGERPWSTKYVCLHKTFSTTEEIISNNFENKC